MQDVKKFIRPSRTGKIAPQWRAVYLVGPVWCDRCGRPIHRDVGWERNIPHVTYGKFRCQGCPPGIAK